MTEDEINAGRSPAGGFTKKQLAKWGVPWPPPAGWKDALIQGKSVLPEGAPAAGDLLRALCLAVIGAGRADILHGLPDVVGYFGGRLPTELEIAASQRGLRNDGGDVPWEE